MPWIDACTTDEIDEEDVIGWDHSDRTFAEYPGADEKSSRADGLCPHWHIHLSDGLAKDQLTQRPGHHGLFDYRTGEAVRRPVFEALVIYPETVADSRIPVEVE